MINMLIFAINIFSEMLFVFFPCRNFKQNGNYKSSAVLLGWLRGTLAFRGMAKAHGRGALEKRRAAWREKHKDGGGD